MHGSSGSQASGTQQTDFVALLIFSTSLHRRLSLLRLSARPHTICCGCLRSARRTSPKVSVLSSSIVYFGFIFFVQLLCFACQPYIDSLGEAMRISVDQHWTSEGYIDDWLAAQPMEGACCAFVCDVHVQQDLWPLTLVSRLLHSTDLLQ